MLLLKFDSMSTSVWKSVTNPHLLVCRQRSPQWGRCFGILAEDVKITHFEPLHVRQINREKNVVDLKFDVDRYKGIDVAHTLIVDNLNQDIN